jgi:hypothetical protein
MRMARRVISVFLALVLVLGWTGASAFAAGAACASLAASVADNAACKGCNDTGEGENPRCPALACVSVCAAGPMISMVREAWFAAPEPDGRAATLPAALRLAARSIPPDIPPPR